MHGGKRHLACNVGLFALLPCKNIKVLFCFVLKKKQQKKCIEFQEIPGINCLVRLWSSGRWLKRAVLLMTTRFLKRSPIICKLMRKWPPSHLIYHLSEQFPGEFTVSVASFQSSSVQHGFLFLKMLIPFWVNEPFNAWFILLNGKSGSLSVSKKVFFWLRCCMLTHQLTNWKHD